MDAFYEENNNTITWITSQKSGSVSRAKLPSLLNDNNLS